MASISKTVRPKRSSNRTVTPSGFGLTVSRGTPAAAAGSTATQLAVTTQPAGAVTGSAFTTQPVVQLRNSGGGNVSEAGITVTAYLVSGSGILGGAKTAVTNSSGAATFANLQITGTGAHVLGFHALMSQVQTIWSDDVETDRSASYFEVETAGGRFGRATDPVSGSLAWKSTYQSGTQVNHGSLHLAFGRTPDAYMAPVYGSTIDFGEVTAEFDLRHTIGSPFTDKLYRCHVFSAGDFSQAAQCHAWAEGTSQLRLDPATGTSVAGVVLTSGYNDFANLTFLGAVAGTAGVFGSTATTSKRIKVVTRLDAPGQANGFMQQYVDGVLDAQATGLALVKSYTGYGINAAYFEAFTNTPNAQTYDRYYDNISVTGRARAVVAANSLSVGVGGGTHEPANYTPVTSQAFSSLPSNGWYVDIGSLGSNMDLVTDATAPESPSSVLRFTYPTGWAAGGAPGKIEYPPINSTSIYYRIVFRHSANFYGNSSQTNKMAFADMHNSGTFFFNARGSGTGDLLAVLHFQNVPSDEIICTPNLSAGVLTRGVWHTFEALLESGAAGTATSRARGWLDGIATHDYQNLTLSSGGQTNDWDYVSIYPIWGGTSGTVPATQTWDIDHVYVSKQ